MCICVDVFHTMYDFNKYVENLIYFELYSPIVKCTYQSYLVTSFTKGNISPCVKLVQAQAGIFPERIRVESELRVSEQETVNHHLCMTFYSGLEQHTINFPQLVSCLKVTMTRAALTSLYAKVLLPLFTGCVIMFKGQTAATGKMLSIINTRYSCTVDIMFLRAFSVVEG